MNQNNPKFWQFNLSGISFLLTILAAFLLLRSIGLGGVINGFLILIGLLIITPSVALLVFQWWLKRNQIQDNCPVCSYEFTAFNGVEFQCPSCGEPLTIESRHFQRLTPPGTIEVKAVEVSAQVVED